MTKRVADEEIVAMYRAGATVSEICVELNIYSPQIYQALDRQGIQRKTRDPNFIDPRIREPKWDVNDETFRQVAVEYMIKEKSARQISAELGLPYTRVLRMLKHARIQIVPGRHGRRYEGVRKQIQRALLTPESEPGGDRTMLQIATDLGVPLREVERVAKNLAEFKQTFRSSKWGKAEAVVEEVMHRIREEGVDSGMVEVGEKAYQKKLPGF